MEPETDGGSIKKNVISLNIEPDDEFLLVQIQSLANNKGSQEVSISLRAFYIFLSSLLILVCWADSNL